jgi:phosphate transport system permease protein
MTVCLVPQLTSNNLQRKYIAQNIIRQSIRGLTYALVFLVGWILLDIAVKGFPALLAPDFILGFPKDGGAQGGILPAIVGTVALVLTSLSLALFFGLATAIYLSEYAPNSRLTRSIRMTILTLSGVPSIVFGLFGLTLFVVFCKLGPCILAGGLTLACMALPTVIVASEEALKAVPRSLREGSIALGATQWQTIQNHVLPYAIPGILTGVVLSIGRVAGETAPIIFTAAAFYLPVLPKSILDQVMALPYHLYVLATQHPDPNARVLQYGTALVLLLIVLSLNGVATLIRQHYRKRIKW